MPVATMEFASLCLRNSLALLMEDPLTATPPPVSDDQPETRYVSRWENILILNCLRYQVFQQIKLAKYFMLNL